ncbi:copper amine oxidase N-terminal domain-containing protein [Paenibacillus sp. LHD-117]|uniref:copper amine oxidase N-terminal domain-containing protein n=1 Tax=Paenibacillus sp. LHD-117 TaxID=3071412 RepID=UPI0027DF05CB|nr:copper amine oxidase N-terminal domain-containing protein [Paenibacillus sp. LHD-117]MDQ6419843.1 copper amine oxidase N-terminal domain-containing protein [Paenibacillus sp. LHD-117]
MKNKLLKRAAVAVLALAVMIVAGCQAIAGLDLNQVLKNAAKVTSGESKSSFEFQLRLNEDALEEYEEEEADFYRLISHIKVELDRVLVEDESNLSLEGSLSFGDLGIPFGLRMSETTMVLELEGAKKPIAIDLSDEAIASMSGVEISEGNEVSQEEEETIAEIGRQITDLVSGYAINNLPNPSGLSATPVTEPIGGVQTSMMKLQFTMDGPAIWEWIKSYLDALLNDREGLEATVRGILELLENNPVYWEMLGEINPLESDELDAPTVDDMAKEAVDEIVLLLESYQEEIEWMETEDKETLDSLLNESLQLKMDTYVDAKLDIRKQALELNYELEDDMDEELELPFTGFTLKTSSEHWNVNGSVAADEPAVTDDMLTSAELEELEGHEALEYVDEQSALYELLKNKLHVTRQTYFAYSDDYYNPPIIVPGYITIVAVRDVADAFGASTTYEAATREITVHDELTNTRIVMKVGSDVVKVNGKEEVWPFPVMTVDGTTYVPARKLAEALGADIEWQTVYEDWKELSISREP